MRDGNLTNMGLTQAFQRGLKAGVPVCGMETSLQDIIFVVASTG